MTRICICIFTCACMCICLIIINHLIIIIIIVTIMNQHHHHQSPSNAISCHVSSCCPLTIHRCEIGEIFDWLLHLSSRNNIHGKPFHPWESFWLEWRIRTCIKLSYSSLYTNMLLYCYRMVICIQVEVLQRDNMAHHMYSNKACMPWLRSFQKYDVTPPNCIRFSCLRWHDARLATEGKHFKAPK